MATDLKDNMLKLAVCTKKTKCKRWLTPGCQPLAPKTTMSTNFERPSSFINVGSSATCRLCRKASGTKCAVVHGSSWCFGADVAISQATLNSKENSGRSLEERNERMKKLKETVEMVESREEQ